MATQLEMQTNMVVQAESQGHRMPEREGTLETSEHTSVTVTIQQIGKVY